MYHIRQDDGYFFTELIGNNSEMVSGSLYFAKHSAAVSNIYKQMRILNSRMPLKVIDHVSGLVFWLRFNRHGRIEKFNEKKLRR